MKCLLVLFLSTHQIFLSAPSHVHNVKSSRQSESSSSFIVDDAKELWMNPQNRNLSSLRRDQKDRREKPGRPGRDEQNPWILPSPKKERGRNGSFPREEIIKFSLILEGRSSVTQYKDCCRNILKLGIDNSVEMAEATTSRRNALKDSGRLLSNNHSNRRLVLLEAVTMHLPSTNMLGKVALRSHISHFSISL